ncbi:NUDIX hydrolase [Peribacillus asahii]|uniref:NUDIX hydrolase n=1 Tax=Peribacillus asahii TaxID=228899 RepID=UPI0037FED8B4
MSEVKALFQSKWVTVNEKTLDNGGKYLYMSSDWCKSKGVAILPYREVVVNAWGHKELQFLGRYELCPAHSDEIELGAIMGGMDKEGEEPVVTAWRELQEEAGYKVPIENIVYLGTARPSKASDNTIYLFGVNVDKGFELVDATGDGTLVEEGGYSKWVSKSEMVFAKEPLLSVMHMRLQQTGGKGI